MNRSEGFVYDPNGNLTQFTDRKGQISTFTYDPLNRRTRSQFADGTSTTFTYDSAGRLMTATDSTSGAIHLVYDALDRLRSETTSQGTIAYTYDAIGRRTSMTVDGQPPVAYTYDANSRLRSIAQSSSLSPVTIDYDALGRRTRLTLPNGVSTEYQYDAASRLTALIYRNALGVLGDLRYTYDPAGNRTAVGGSFARTLLPDPVLSATYDAANQQLAFGAKSMTFDQNGNLTSIADLSGTTTFTWDARNRLIALSGPGVSATFAYDALDRRTQVMGAGGTRITQDDLANPVRDLIDGQETLYLQGPRLDQPLLVTSGLAVSGYLTDPLGSVLALADASGNLTTTYTYGPFGETASTGAISTNPFQFTSRENDATGLYYYRARYYHPGLGRFLAEDPLRLLGGPNAYAYVRNRPTQFRDALGLQEEFGFSAVAPVVTPTQQLVAAAPVIAVLAVAAPGPIVAATISGALTGLTGGAITGRTEEAAAVGAFAGSVVGALGPVRGPASLSPTRQALAGGMTNLIGQAAGNFATDQNVLDYNNYSLGAVAGSALARAAGIATGLVPGGAELGRAVTRGIVNGVLSGLGAIIGGGLEEGAKLGCRKGFPCAGFL